jgi:hypothetical protein
MEEAGESRGGRLGEGVILTRRGTVRHLFPHPLLHYSQYVPLDCASGSISGTKPRGTFHLRGKEKGGAMMLSPLVNGSSHANYVAFSIAIYCFITTWPRGHLQPSTLFASFNFNPRCHFIPLQLQSSLPTSTLVAIQILNPVAVLFPPLFLDDARGVVLDAPAAR